MTTELTLTPAPVAEQRSRTRKQGWQYALVIVLLMIAGGACGFVLGKFGFRYLPKPTALDILWLIPALWGVIAWHELGHVIGAQLAGFRLALYAAGPLLIKREDDRLQVSFNRTPAYWGGLAASMPGPDYPVDTERLRRDMLRCVAFGPMFSVIGGLALPFGFPGAFFGALSLMIAIATLIPNRLGGFTSDGLRILQLRRKGAEAKRWASMAGLMGVSTVLRPREWPEEWVKAGSEPREETVDGVSGAWLRSTWHFDRDEWSEAESWLAFAVHNACLWPAPMRPVLYSDAAFFSAWVKQDVEGARRWMELAGPRAKDIQQGKLATAALHIAEGKGSEARSILEGLKIPGPAGTLLVAEMLRRATAL